jgi:peptide/nickel transport system permease protein
MIPTFLGILVINFAVLRLQGLNLAQQMAAATPSGEGERKVEAANQAVETWLTRFRRTGNDLPALVNLRGFVGTGTIVDRLEAAERRPGRSEAERQRAELEDLWFQGPLLVEPLTAVLADDAQARLHGPASMALSLCAYRPLLPEDLDRIAPAEQNRIRARNEELKRLRIAYLNTADGGYRTQDPRAVEKRSRLLALLAADRAEFARDGRRWSAILAETGFSDFMGRLCTGRLYSETRKAWVFSLIADRWQVTFGLSLTAILIAWGISIPLGIRSARRAGTVEDGITTNVLFLTWSLPSFFVGTLLLHHLCTDHGGGAWFPNRGLSSPDNLWMSTPAYLLDVLWHAVLPLTVLCYASFTSLSRYMRANVLEQLSSDYARTARAKGCDEDTVTWRHVVPNSMITMITLGAGLLAGLFGGSVVVEYIFSIPGLGSLLLDAARQQDAPLVMGSTIISVLLLLVGILIADLLYGVVDPRIRARYA